MAKHNDLQTRTWVEMARVALARDSQQPVLAFPEGRLDQSGFKYYTPEQLQTLTLRAASFYADHGLRPRQKGEAPLVIALFGYGTIDWAVSSAYLRSSLCWY